MPKRCASTPDGASEAQKRMRLMWESKEFSDVNIRCSDRVWPLHRSVLASASPVFARMFNSEMREAKDREVEIRDADPDVLSQLLEYIYTADAPILKEATIPKRPLSAFFNFVTEMKETHPKAKGQQSSEYVREVSKRWAELPSMQRQQYESQASKEKEEYENALRDFKAGIDGVVEKSIALLQLASMYEVKALMAVCCCEILKTNKFPVQSILPMVRAVRENQGDPAFIDIWKRLREEVGKSEEAFAALCNGV